MDETKIEPIRNRNGLTYYEWLVAADGTSHANGKLHRQWVDGVDPAEVKAAFDLELQQIRERLKTPITETKEDQHAHPQLDANRSQA